MTLYGYAREPDSPDGEIDPPAGPRKVTSQPVSVPGDQAAPPPGPDSFAPSVPETFAPSATESFAPSAAESSAPTAADAIDPSAPDASAAPERPATPAFGGLDDWDFDDEAEAIEVQPWDRRPLMVVIAGAAALVLLAVLSGFAVAAMLGPGGSSAGWRAVQPSPTSAPAGPVVPGDTITLSGVGDVIMGSVFHGLPPGGGRGFFDEVKSSLAADLVMGNLETPLTADTGYVKCNLVTPPATPGNPSPSPTKDRFCHQFYLPTSYTAPLRAAGFQVLNLANNHANDMGPAGLRNTRAALEAAGIQHTGGRNQITYVDVKGVRVAVLGFGFSPSGQSVNDVPAAAALVRRADETADLVVIQMQGGAEGASQSHVRNAMETFAGEFRGNLVRFSHAVIDAGADVVFGHGPHIMRGMEFYKGRIIAYSLGNFCGYRTLSSAGYQGVGGVLRVTLRKDGTWAGGQLIATEMVRGGMVTVDSDKRALTFVDGLSRSDFGAAAARVSPTEGTITPPVA